VQWLRGGTTPEIEQVTFEFRHDEGSTWTALASGKRISGGWAGTGLNLPAAAWSALGAARTAGLFNGSSSLIEQVSCLFFGAILINPGYLPNQPFQCTVIGQPGTLCVVEAATSVVDASGVPLQTNQLVTFIDTTRAASASFLSGGNALARGSKRPAPAATKQGLP